MMNSWRWDIEWNRCSGGKGDDRAHKMDTSKMEALGFPPFLSIQQMFDDCIKSFQEKGLLLP